MFRCSHAAPYNVDAPSVGRPCQLKQNLQCAPLNQCVTVDAILQHMHLAEAQPWQGHGTVAFCTFEESALPRVCESAFIKSRLGFGEFKPHRDRGGNIGNRYIVMTRLPLHTEAVNSTSLSRLVRGA